MSSYPTRDSVHEEARWPVHVPPSYIPRLSPTFFIPPRLAPALHGLNLYADLVSFNPSSLQPTSSSSSLIDQSHPSTRTIIGFALLGVGGLGICLALASVLYIKRRTKCAPPVLAHDLVGQYHLRGIGIYAGRVRRRI